MMSVVEKLKILKKMPLFNKLSFDEMAELGKITTVHKFEAGSRIIDQNDAGDSLYIIINGKMRVFRNQDGAEQDLAVLGNHDYFGEMALIDEKPRSASVEAMEETVLLRLGKEDFRNLVYLYPVISFELMKELTRRIREKEAWGLPLPERRSGP